LAHNGTITTTYPNFIGPKRDSRDHTHRVLHRDDSRLATIEQARERHDTEQQALVDNNIAIRTLHPLLPPETRDVIPPVYWPKPFPAAMLRAAERRADELAVKGNPSGTMVLPYFDKFRCTVFDTMHNILQGINQTHLKGCLMTGKYKDDNTTIDPIEPDWVGDDAASIASNSSIMGSNTAPSPSPLLASAWSQAQRAAAAAKGASPQAKRRQLMASQGGSKKATNPAFPVLSKENLITIQKAMAQVS
jgi:hypothetical protein